ncbi:MAG: ribosome biogenesis GTPase YlqF [Geminocystis sp.]|nr:ribosome biogenesis GTPase YlqF [Geminocystis sp.]HIK38843.1 ribosome biogenesis GTPase YlqF [Geminocystis sp. M7585_C2015_104]MCS7147168.1 ribosome biogenesis GTPase YlqF [Geminocystis sp.]MCX8078607.1 ribosome biogenesis GTPase YlqF [Geminocystis sp.]MDW8116164.1 ribosome biogenesis GTPase YlqF [Geminocystis sp.]
MAVIQWYPGHISKAEKQLKEQLKLVDVVLEVRDARIPLASHHPQLKQWIGNKPRLLVINREDLIPETVKKQWQEWFESKGERPFFTNAQTGKGVNALRRAALSQGVMVNERRRQRGMLPRPVRAVVVGFPNVGKSALINRLLQRRVVASARRPGVTRQLQWVRISEHLELLDTPGVIPGRLDNQQDAVKLAICEDIGEAAYDNQVVAGHFVELLVKLGQEEILHQRYLLNPKGLTGEDYLHTLAYKRYKGDVERAARQLLQDFRTGVLGPISLEYPPKLEVSL